MDMEYIMVVLLYGYGVYYGVNIMVILKIICGEYYGHMEDIMG